MKWKSIGKLTIIHICNEFLEFLPLTQRIWQVRTHAEQCHLIGPISWYKSNFKSSVRRKAENTIISQLWHSNPNEIPHLETLK